MTTPRTDDTTPDLPWAQTHTLPYAVPAGERADEQDPPATAPALNPPTWSGRKTAVAAALALGISTLGATGAAAALPAGSQQGGGQVQQGGFGPGGRGPGGFNPPGINRPGFNQGRQGTQQGAQQGTPPGSTT